MPILTKELIKSSEKVECGWTKFKLIEGKTQVKDGFTNDMLIFEGLEGPGNSNDNVGRRFTHLIFGKALTPGSTIPEVVDNMLKLIAALTNQTLEEVKEMEGEFKFSKMEGREVWANLKETVSQGKTYTNAAEWAPENVDPR